jgi:hypothetical protein
VSVNVNVQVNVKGFAAVTVLVCLIALSFSAQTPHDYTATPVAALSTELDDLPFGADSEWIYVMQYGAESGAQYFRAPRNSDATHPGVLEATSLQTIRDEAWSELGVISHVSVDADRQLAVISAKPYPGAGDFDLFISSLTKRGYSRPYPLYSLNTAGDEVYPQFTSSGLYYSSNNDIYFASKKHQWQKAVALDAPINTSADEISIAILNDHEMYVSSNRAGGGFDVYLLSYEVDENLASGYTLELVCNGLPVTGAEISWVALDTGNPVFEGLTDVSGQLSLEGLPSSRTLGLRVGSIETPTKPGSVVRILNLAGKIVRTYDVGRSGLLAADFLPLDEVDDLNLLTSLDLSTLPGRSPALISIHFEIDSKSPTETSLQDLDGWWVDIKNSLFLGSDSPLIIEGHADITGSLGSNDRLSELRAVWFKEWLLDKGMDESRLSTRGMGARFPMVVCPDNSSGSSDFCPPEVHAANRRVELRWKVD